MTSINRLSWARLGLMWAVAGVVLWFGLNASFEIYEAYGAACHVHSCPNLDIEFLLLRYLTIAAAISLPALIYLLCGWGRENPGK